MNENLDPTDEHFSPEEQDIEKVLRPLSFDDFAGPVSYTHLTLPTTPYV